MGPRLNRYYTSLKPFYRVDHSVVDEPDSPRLNEDAPKLPSDRTLVFESRFESGNLRKAVKIGPNEYELYMKNDYST